MIKHRNRKRTLRTVLNPVVIAVLLVCSIALPGCTGQEPEKKTFSIGIIQLIDNGAFTDMREGFLARLEEKGYGEDKVSINYKNAQGDATNLNSICKEMIDNKSDLIVTIATPPTQAIVNMETDIPVIFISVANPIGAGVISDMSKPDKNATGTSNAIPIADIFELADKLTPGCETYGLIYCMNEVNSVTTIENAKAYLTDASLGYVEAVVSNSSEVQQAVQALVGKVDAIFVPNDSVIQNAMPLVAEVAREAKLPVYGSSAVMVDGGALATVAISDTEIGAISADMAIKYIEGAKIKDIPAVTVPADDTVINRTTAEILGLTFSEEDLGSVIFLED